MVVLVLLGSTTEALADVQTNGNVYALYSIRTRNVDCDQTPSCALPLAEERFQLKMSGSSESTVASSFLGTVDFVADHVTHSTRVEPRQIYADLTWRSLTVRGGWQLITWGIGDYVFVNDIFPKNFESFFLGRPTEYLKEPSGALRITAPHIDFVLLPVFEPDHLPSPLRFAYADPLPPDAIRTFSTPSAAIENAEAALRLPGTLGRWDVALYGYRGFSRSPALASPPQPPADVPQTLVFRYPRLNTAGASVEGPLFGGLFGVEGAYYDSEDDRAGSNPFIDNSEVRALASYTHPLWEDASIGVQALSQTMMNYDEYAAVAVPGFPTLKRTRWTGTLRFTQLLVQQLVQFNFFAFVGITEHDAYLIPSLRYALTDNLSVEAVGNVFLGEGETSFGRFRHNSNVRLGMQYGF